MKNPKARAALSVLAGTGLRRSELGQAVLEGTYLRLTRVKGWRERLVPIPPDLIPDYITATEEPYHPDTLGHLFARAICKARIDPRRRSLHSLRHTFALRQYAYSRDIFYVRGLLGHTTVKTTEVYMQFPEKYLAQVSGEDCGKNLHEIAHVAVG